MKMVFREKNGAERYFKTRSEDYKSERDFERVFKTSKSELNELIPDNIDFNSWEKVRRKYVVENDLIGFDKDYTPSNEAE